MSSYVLLLFLIILNVVQLFTTAIVVTVHALAIVVNVVSQHTVSRCSERSLLFPREKGCQTGAERAERRS